GGLEDGWRHGCALPAPLLPRRHRAARRRQAAAVKAVANGAAFAAGLVLAVLALPAGAHAFLHHADPRVGSTVAHSPAQVTLPFTEKLEPAFSTLKVLDAAGKEVDAHDLK